jgi:hypothetical protein
MAQLQGLENRLAVINGTRTTAKEGPSFYPRQQNL